MHHIHINVHYPHLLIAVRKSPHADYAQPSYYGPQKSSVTDTFLRSWRAPNPPTARAALAFYCSHYSTTISRYWHLTAERDRVIGLIAWTQCWVSFSLPESRQMSPTACARTRCPLQMALQMGAEQVTSRFELDPQLMVRVDFAETCREWLFDVCAWFDMCSCRDIQKYNFYTSRYLCYDMISVKGRKKNAQKQKCQEKAKIILQLHPFDPI
jgi:hypothetical protein